MPLYFAICLRVEGDEELFFDAKKVIKQEPKFGGQNCLIVANNGVEKVLILYYYINNYLCKS